MISRFGFLRESGIYILNKYFKRLFFISLTYFSNYLLSYCSPVFILLYKNMSQYSQEMLPNTVMYNEVLKLNVIKG